MNLFSCFMDERSVAVAYPASSLAGDAYRAIMNSAHRIPIGANGLVGPALLPGLPCAGLTCHAIKLSPLRNWRWVLASSLGHLALRACSGMASPFLPDQSLHAECRLPGR